MPLDNYQNFLSNLSFGSLFLSMLFYITSLVFPSFQLASKLGQMTSLLANLSIFLILASRWLFHGYFPLSNLYESLLFLSWVLLFIHLLLEYKTRSKLLGAIVLPLVLFIDGFGNFSLPIEMQKASPLVPALQSNWLMMHVSLMMLSYGSLIIGSLISILFLMLSLKGPLGRTERKNSSPNSLSLQKMGTSLSLASSPSSSFVLKLLENMDNLSYRIISLGFPFLTLGIIAGAVWANEAWGSYWSWDPKETWALITWLVFAAYLHARIVKGWEGKRPAILASVGFFVVWFCYLGVNFLGQGLHSYGWMN
jgi:cytochrome c-type biogenesis protein CcsB